MVRVKRNIIPGEPAWKYVDLTPGELSAHTFESMTTEHRSERPLCVLTALEHLDGYVAINLFAKGRGLPGSCHQQRFSGMPRSDCAFVF